MGKGRKPCCDKSKVKRGAWTPAEDLKLISFVQKYGHDNWRSLPKLAGLARCGKSCRLRWINYLRPDLKRGNFTKEEEEAIIILHQTLGNKWSKIASNFPGRTDNEIKNLWNTHLKKRAAKQQDSGGATKKPRVSEPTISTSSSSSSTSSTATNSTPAAGGDGFEALLSDEFSPPANFGLAGDIPVEIPFELDVDFWSFLDGLNPFEEQNKNNNDGGHEKYSSNLGETEDTKWLRYIENELGLEPTGISPEVNSEIGYYHLWPSL